MRAIQITKYRYGDYEYTHSEYDLNQHRYTKCKADSSIDEKSSREEFEEAVMYGTFISCDTRKPQIRPRHRYKLLQRR